MTDPRTLAQREGPEAMEALVRKLFRANDSMGSYCESEMVKAARKLAEPEPVTPVWPSGKLWAWFHRKTGEFSHAQEARPAKIDHVFTAVPCRVVPADAVVLTREEAVDIRNNSHSGWVALDAALLREREAQ